MSLETYIIEYNGFYNTKFFVLTFESFEVFQHELLHKVNKAYSKSISAKLKHNETLELFTSKLRKIDILPEFIEEDWESKSDCDSVLEFIQDAVMDRMSPYKLPYTHKKGIIELQPD